MHALSIRRKWRPSLAMVIGALCVLLVALPMVAVLAARLLDGRLVRETEGALQTQAALLAAVFAEAMDPALAAEPGGEPAFGRVLDPAHAARRAARFDPAEPRLSLNAALLDPLPLIPPDPAAKDGIAATEPIPEPIPEPSRAPIPGPSESAAPALVPVPGPVSGPVPGPAPGPAPGPVPLPAPPPSAPALSQSADIADPLPQPQAEALAAVAPSARRAAADVAPAATPYDAVAPRLEAIIRAAKRRTLTGYIVTDADGIVIASSGVIGGDLGHVPEIAAALRGEDVATLRRRGDGPGRHPLTSISRNTGYRVFVAQPVVARGRIVGAVLVSRTPTDVGRFLYRERATAIRVAAIMILGAGLAGWLFWRLISRPVRGIAAQSRAVADRTRPLPAALQHYGVRELAGLGESVLSMARTLDERAALVETYTAHVTHELKSPTTAILGAAEMLRAAEEAPDHGTIARMAPARRARLVATIEAQGRRMNTLLERLRTLSRARLADRDRTVALEAAAAALRASDPGLEVAVAGPAGAMLPLSAEQAAMALGQLAANARQHGATRLTLSYAPEGPALDIADDGRGIDPADRARVLEPFFTTRREAGGTGMGLAIVAAIAETSGGRLTLEDAASGTRFRLAWG